MAGDGVTDERTLLAGTGANVIGLAAGVLAAFGVQLLLGRSLPNGVPPSRFHTLRCL